MSVPDDWRSTPELLAWLESVGRRNCNEFWNERSWLGCSCGHFRVRPNQAKQDKAFANAIC